MKLLNKLPRILAAFALTVCMPVLAMNLQQAMGALPDAKQQGLVGERADGYLGVVRADGDSADVVRLINEARRAEYQKMADQNKITLQDVEAIAGKKAIDRTESGNYVDAGSGWLQKP